MLGKTLTWPAQDSLGRHHLSCPCLHQHFVTNTQLPKGGHACLIFTLNLSPFYFQYPHLSYSTLLQVFYPSVLPHMNHRSAYFPLNCKGTADFYTGFVWIHDSELKKSLNSTGQQPAPSSLQDLSKQCLFTVTFWAWTTRPLLNSYSDYWFCSILISPFKCCFLSCHTLHCVTLMSTQWVICSRI